MTGSTALRLLRTVAERSGLGLALHRLASHGKVAFVCPICHYRGPFADVSPATGLRKHAKCPKCGALERHRLQYLVVKSLAERYDFSRMSLLHIAPEAFFRSRFKSWFGGYTTADLEMPGVDYNIDLSDLPFSNESYDCVFASHVLEHIKNDRQAVSEIRRILKPAGLAILPVPIVAETTVEYAEANPHESGHVRAPGLDYYERYWEFFDNVEQLTSADYPPEFQLFTYADRTRWVGETTPFHRLRQDNKYVDIVPICHVAEQ